MDGWHMQRCKHACLELGSQYELETTQLAGLHYFGDLASDSLDAPEPGLHLVRYTSVRDALRSLDVTIDSEFSLDPYFLFQNRATSAQSNLNQRA
jgi:hypothetical protein